MTNHYHLVIETPDGNLSKGMRQLNGVYTQYSNRRHRRVGHLFQGRYKAILVDCDSYLLELARYVVLNPVRARMVDDPGAWRWSSYLAMIGAQPAPAWLATDGLLAAFGKRRSHAVRRYMEFVAQGVDAEPVWRNLKSQVFLGSDDFVAQSLLRAEAKDDVNIPHAQRRPPRPHLMRSPDATQIEMLRWSRPIRPVATAISRSAISSAFISRRWQRPSVAQNALEAKLPDST